MKTVTIELDQFRDQLDQALTKAEQGELILTRQGKPWIVMRPASDDRAVDIPSEVRSRGKSVNDPRGAHGDTVLLVGETAAWARAYFERVYKTTIGDKAFVDGKQVPEDFVLQEGQVLEFAEEEEEEWAAELHRSPAFWEMIRRRRSEVAIPWDEAKRRLELNETEAVGPDDETQPARVEPTGRGAASY